ncbi:MAG: hypothetical protein DI568_17030 [Sphingomonas sp.]|nr:MAG: hypothetical protein DI568_17030 [Sphingomonas sp.]
MSDAFMAALLEPLPEREEAVDSQKYIRSLARDEGRAWRRQWEHAKGEVKAWSDILSSVRVLRRGASGDMFRGREGVVQMMLMHAIAEMMLVPAPTLADLRFKRRWLRPFLFGKVKTYLRAIEADAERLGECRDGEAGSVELPTN